jgi:hypothetical protein
MTLIDSDRARNKPIDQHTSGAKMDQDKIDMSLLGLLRNSLLEICRVMDYGQTKYTRGGFLDVPNAMNRYTAAMFRHWLKEDIELYDSGDPFYDTEKGLPYKGTIRHDAQVAVNALFRLEYKLRQEEQDTIDLKVALDMARFDESDIQDVIYGEINKEIMADNYHPVKGHGFAPDTKDGSDPDWAPRGDMSDNFTMPAEDEHAVTTFGPLTEREKEIFTDFAKIEERAVNFMYGDLANKGRNHYDMNDVHGVDPHEETLTTQPFQDSLERGDGCPVTGVVYSKDKSDDNG